MPDGGLFTVRIVGNKTGAKFDLLCEILPELGSKDAEVRASAAAQLTAFLTLSDLTYEALAYLIAWHGDRRAVASAAALMPSWTDGIKARCSHDD